ncbi:MAG TPA: hypothetical protein PLW77_00725 [Bacteroidales bacterium]|nr:hypothetical protein [Bacteroidales bacterium]HQB20877.1 hypothetical protein [Bacteroidales bacterium]
MKTFRIAVLFVYVLAALGIASCKDKPKTEETTPKPQDNPILKLDALAQSSDVKIIESFENENPLKVHFVDKNDEKQAYEKQYYENGNLFMEGSLVDGKREGKWTAYYENGVVWSIGYYENGLKQGKSEVFYENGKVRYMKSYKDDLADGLWQFYDDKGNLVGEEMYKEGKKVE